MRGSPGNFRDFFGGRTPFDGLNSLFEELWGSGGRQRPQQAPVSGQDLEQTVEISFEESVRGTTAQVQVMRRDGGAERLQVKIPPGVDTGSKVRIAGKGEPGRYGGPPGDLYIVIRARPHAYLTRQGNDILCEVPVTLTEVLLGAKIDVPTIDGKITMTLPAGTQNGRRFRLRGKGVPALQGWRARRLLRHGPGSTSREARCPVASAPRGICCAESSPAACPYEVVRYSMPAKRGKEYFTY